MYVFGDNLNKFIVLKAPYSPFTYSRFIAIYFNKFLDFKKVFIIECSTIFPQIFSKIDKYYAVEKFDIFSEFVIHSRKIKHIFSPSIIILHTYYNVINTLILLNGLKIMKSRL